jgi:hypothetical protein
VTPSPVAVAAFFSILPNFASTLDVSAPEMLAAVPAQLGDSNPHTTGTFYAHVDSKST